jgi:predicted acylesterase/phospholipase RssA
VRLGLALSGGGFRAAAFHLGVLRGLHGSGLLERVDTISGVSGGALLAAAYACRPPGDFAAFEARMRRFLSRDLKRRVVFAALRPDRVFRLLVQPSYSLTEVLAEVVDREVLGGRMIGSLAGQHPRLVLNATCINHGTGFRFTPERIGDWRVSTTDRDVLDRFPVARAVAASAAFPGGFAPLVLARPQLGGSRRAPREILLTDGGVDDNFGVEPLADCDVVLVSDGSFPFEADDRPLDAYGLTVGRRLMLAVVLVALALLGSDRFGVPGAILVALSVAAVLVALRLRLALFLFGSVMMRGQRRGVLRRLFGRDERKRCIWLGLGTALEAEDEQELARAGVDRDRLRRVRTDLDLGARDLDGLVALGEALVRERALPVLRPDAPPAGAAAIG